MTSNLPTLFLNLLLVAMCGCVSSPKRSFASKYQGPFSWPPAKYSKVLGYAFKLPTNTGSLIKRNQEGIDHKRLVRDAIRFDQLSPEQVNDLLGALLKPTIRSRQFYCYDPRHMFVFYSEAGKPVAAIEVCYHCGNIMTWPAVADGNHGIDFITLRQIRDQLGLKLTASEERLSSP